MKTFELREKLNKSFKRDYWEYFGKHPLKAFKYWFFLKFNKQYQDLKKYYDKS